MAAVGRSNRMIGYLPRWPGLLLVSMERPAPGSARSCSWVIPRRWAGRCHMRKEAGRPMSSVARLSGPIHLGMDVAMDSIAVGILPWGQDRPVVDRIAHDEVSVRRLVARLGNPGRLRACYEAGPTGYGLHPLATPVGGGWRGGGPAWRGRRG